MGHNRLTPDKEARRRVTVQDMKKLGVSVPNAGLVLVTPFLPRLLAEAGFIEKGGFSSVEKVHRAISLLQYVCSGDPIGFEREATLSKLLCGCSPGDSSPLSRVVRQEEVAAVEAMLSAVLEHWGIGSTTLSGLRASFLLRPGELYKVENGWRLKVQTKTFDMLLDRLPWSIALIKFDWMEVPVHVEWR